MKLIIAALVLPTCSLLSCAPIAQKNETHLTTRLKHGRPHLVELKISFKGLDPAWLWDLHNYKRDSGEVLFPPMVGNVGEPFILEAIREHTLPANLVDSSDSKTVNTGMKCSMIATERDGKILIVGKCIQRHLIVNDDKSMAAKFASREIYVNATVDSGKPLTITLNDKDKRKELLIITPTLMDPSGRMIRN